MRFHIYFTFLSTSFTTQTILPLFLLQTAKPVPARRQVFSLPFLFTPLRVTAAATIFMTTIFLSILAPAVRRYPRSGKSLAFPRDQKHRPYRAADDRSAIPFGHYTHQGGKQSIRWNHSELRRNHGKTVDNVLPIIARSMDFPYTICQRYGVHRLIAHFEVIYVCSVQ